MEKLWENFWTTGKVEDYLTYRNRVADDADGVKNRDYDKTHQGDRSWKGSNYKEGNSYTGLR